MSRFTRSTLTAACVAGLFCSSLLAGGFFLTLGNPAASHDPKAQGAVLLVRPDGCMKPVNAKVAGTAIGIVGGERQTRSLSLIALDTPGTYAVLQQWPREGTWVLRFVASTDSLSTTTLVPADAEGVHRELAKSYRNKPPEADVEAMLQSTAGAQVAARQ